MPTIVFHNSDFQEEEAIVSPPYYRCSAKWKLHETAKEEIFLYWFILMEKKNL